MSIIVETFTKNEEHLTILDNYPFSPSNGLKIQQLLDKVVSVTANSDELSLILTCFSNIPRPYSESKRSDPDEMTWFGDHAKFIVANLPNL